MHSVSELWRQIFDEPNHRKEVMVKVNGVEYHEERVLYPAPSIVGKLFDAPSVGNARARTLTLNLMPYDSPPGRIPPMSEIRLFVRLKSADGQSVSEWIPKGVFYADEVKRDSDTGATRITAFDAMMKMERPIGNAVVRVTFEDGFGGVQRFRREIGDAMPTPDTPTHEGERFAAWYPNPADTPTLARDMLFTANWAQKFTVIFDWVSGTLQTFHCFAGDATPTPTTPTESGYIFAGWSPTPTATVTADATYTAQWAGLTSVAITEYPAKMIYKIGETLDYTGLSVTATYSNGETRDVTADCVVSPVAGTEITGAATIAVTVSYYGETAGGFDVMIQSIVITSYPTKTDYFVGDALDYTGLAVTARYSNNTTRDITADCALSPANGTTVATSGTITLTVSYDNETLGTFQVSASAVTVQSLSIASYPTKTAYTIGETLDYTGLSVTATYSNGARRNVTTDCTLSPVAGTEVTAAGAITVTASYDGKTATFNVTAEAAQINEPPAFILQAGYPVIWWNVTDFNLAYIGNGTRFPKANHYGIYLRPSENGATIENASVSVEESHVYDGVFYLSFSAESAANVVTMVEYVAYNGALILSGDDEYGVSTYSNPKVGKDDMFHDAFDSPNLFVGDMSTEVNQQVGTAYPYRVRFHRNFNCRNIQVSNTDFYD